MIKRLLSNMTVDASYKILIEDIKISLARLIFNKKYLEILVRES